MLFCIAASASSVLNSEEAALLRGGGCAGNCKQFDCGYESTCGGMVALYDVDLNCETN